MTFRETGWRMFVLAAIAVATIAALMLAPRPADAQSPVANAADRAGDVYKTAVAKAREKRAAKLKKCRQRPTKAKRKACKKAANRAFKQAKKKAKAKRDKARAKARNKGGADKKGKDGPSSPRKQRHDYQDCRRDGGRPSECSGGSRGRP